MPPGIRIERFEATSGKIRIPSLGVVVSDLGTPVLERRREVATPELGSFDLHAAISYFNQALWDDSDFAKTIELTFGKTKPLKVQIQMRPESKLVRLDKALRLEGVEPVWPNEA